MFIPYWVAILFLVCAIGSMFWMLSRKIDNYGNFGGAPFPNRPHPWASTTTPTKCSGCLNSANAQTGRTLKTTRHWGQCGCCAESARESRGDLLGDTPNCDPEHQTLTATRYSGNVVREEVAQGYTL